MTDSPAAWGRCFGVLEPAREKACRAPILALAGGRSRAWRSGTEPGHTLGRERAERSEHAPKYGEQKHRTRQEPVKTHTQQALGTAPLTPQFKKSPGEIEAPCTQETCAHTKKRVSLSTSTVKVFP